MKRIFFLLIISMAPFFLHAQFGNVLNKAKNKIQGRIDNKIDKAIDKELDIAEGKNEGKENDQQGKDAAPVETAKGGIAAYSRYDFIPGEKIIYTEDFSQDEIGELPVNWNASGKGEVVTLENFQGRWLRLFPGMRYFSDNKKDYVQDYTVEFDVVIDGTAPSGTRFFPSFNIGLLGFGDKNPDAKDLFRDYLTKNVVSINMQPNLDAISKMQLSSRNENRNTFESDKQVVASYSKSFFKVAHYAIQVQKQRIRFWVNDQKIFDLPKAVNTASPLNQLFFSVAEYWPYHDNNFGLYISNINVASGLPDTRHKLIEEGSFSTTGILFDVNSAVIKPGSYGVIKEIATVLKENASVNIKVIGHTSADGDDAANLKLSKERAAAVKELLSKEFGVDAGRISTDGKGETSPVADNKTKEGKEQNRRVEFVKA